MSRRPRRTRTDLNPAARFFALVMVLAVIAAACSSGESDTILLGENQSAEAGDAADVETDVADAEAVDFSFETFDEQTLQFSEFADGPVVINFFAAWCATCVAELPDFQTVSEDFDGEVQFLGLSFQDRPEDSLALIEETGVTFPTGLDTNGGILALFQGLGMPTTVFVNADGVVVDVHTGVLTEDALTEAIETELLP